MGSAQSHRNPRASELNANAPTTVWWDVENCPPPRGIRPHTIRNRIIHSLRSLGYNGAVQIIGVIAKDDKVSEDTRTTLQHPNSGVTLFSCNNVTGDKQVSDAEIMARMGQWRDLNIHPRNALMISGDRDFLANCTDLRQLGYNVMLAYRPEATTEEVINSATTKWTWNKLLGWTQKQPKLKIKKQGSPSPPSSPSPGHNLNPLAGCLSCGRA